MSRLEGEETPVAVQNAYYELVYAYANVNVQEEALKLATQQLSDDQQRVRIQVLAEHGGTIEQDKAQVAQSQANLIAAQTVKGAAELLLTKGTHPEQEIDKVTTPKGCTIAGLNEMEHRGFSSSLIKGLVASYDKIAKD